MSQEFGVNKTGDVGLPRAGGSGCDGHFCLLCCQDSTCNYMLLSIFSMKYVDNPQDLL